MGEGFSAPEILQLLLIGEDSLLCSESPNFLFEYFENSGFERHRYEKAITISNQNASPSEHPVAKTVLSDIHRYAIVPV